MTQATFLFFVAPDWPNCPMPLDFEKGCCARRAGWAETTCLCLDLMDELDKRKGQRQDSEERERRRTTKNCPLSLPPITTTSLFLLTFFFFTLFLTSLSHFHSLRPHSFILLHPFHFTSIDQRPHLCFSHLTQITLLSRHTPSFQVHSPSPPLTITTYCSNQQFNKEETRIWNA